MRDIQDSLHLQYRGNRLRRLMSAAGSHLLSAGYLVLYGRHIADTLSGIRAVRASWIRATRLDPDDKLANQRLLSALLRSRADLLEIPVQFFPLSPERVRRTSALEGLRSLAMMCWWRLKRPCPGC